MGFEPTSRGYPLHDFQSCSLDQLGHHSTWKTPNSRSEFYHSSIEYVNEITAKYGRYYRILKKESLFSNFDAVHTAFAFIVAWA